MSLVCLEIGGPNKLSIFTCLIRSLYGEKLKFFSPLGLMWNNRLQGGWSGHRTGNEEKLSNSPVCCLAAA